MRTRRLALRTPVQMVSFFLLGLAFAMGHHFFYNSLHEEEAGGSDKQEWVTRIGTALALLTRSSLIASVSIALVQRIWLLLRNEFFSIKAMDSLFAVKGDPLEFLRVEMFARAPSAYLIGAVIWLLPFAAVLPPGTLSIISIPLLEKHLLPVPMIDFSATEKFFLNYSNSGSGGPLPNLIGTTSASAFTMRLLPISPPHLDWTNSSWTSTFYGPTVKCDAANYSIKAFIENATLHSKLGPNQLEPADPWGISFFAVSPGFMGVEYPYMELFLYGKSLSGPGPKQKILSNTYLVCSLQNASYTVYFNFTNGIQSISMDPFVYRLPYNASEQGNPYVGIFLCLLDLLEGNVGIFNEYWQSPYSTSVLQTAIAGSPDMNQSNYGGAGGDPHQMTSPMLSQAQSAARGRSMGELVEELFTNMTLSLFSSSQFLTNATRSPDTEVQTERNINVYRYSSRNLLLSYGIALLVTLIGMAIGLASLHKNGVSMDANFSTFLRTTRNTELDKLTEGQSLGQLPLDDQLAKTRLKLLEIGNDHVGFATEGQQVRRDGDYPAVKTKDDDEQDISFTGTSTVPAPEPDQQLQEPQRVALLNKLAKAFTF